jgi:hypothetical protein
MSQARDEAGNIWELDAQGNAVRLISAAGASEQPGIIGQRNPYKMPHEAAEVDNSLADLRAKQQRESLFPTDARKAAADTSKAEADATLAQMKADSAKADAALATMSANSDVHGDAYLQKYVPAAMRETVKAYARGDLGSRSGGLSTSMLPIIQHALNYDPTTSATNFPARVKMQSDLAGSQPGTAGGALRAMERMLLHGREVLTAGQGLNNFGSGLLGTIGNTVRTGYEQATNDPNVRRYEQLVRNYAPESQKAIAQTSGGVNERQEREDAYKASLPQDARAAALQGDARQAFDAMGAVNNQYKRLMGRDILDQLSPEAKKAYDLIMAGGYDEQGKALHPATGYTPGGVFSGGDPEGGSGGPAIPPAGGPTNPYGYDPNQPQGDPRGTLTASTAQTINQDDPKVRSIVDGMIRAGKSGAEINSALQPLGYPGVQDTDVKAAQDYLRKNPGYKGGFAQAIKPVEQTMMQRAGNAVGLSAPGAAAIGAYDGLNSLTFGGLGKASDAVTGLPGQSDLAAQAAGQSHPFAKGLGEVAGTLPAFLGGEAALAGLAPRLGGTATLAGRVAASPITADAAAGAYTSAGAADPGNRLQAGALGAVATPLAGMFGRGLARGVGGALTGVQNGAVRLLRDQGVPLTAGQTLSQSGLAGRVVKGVEDRLSSVPIVGDMVNARRTESMRGFNNAAFDEGLRPIKATTGGLTGAEGIDAAKAARSAAYDRVLNPVSVTTDAPFGADFGAAIRQADALPADMAARGNYALDRVGENFGVGGTLDGNGFQQSIRRLRRTGSENAPLPNGQDLGEVMRQGEDAFTGLLQRQSPQTLPAYDAANAANRNVEVLRSAVTNARNGTRSGETDLFTPSQLSDAASANARKFGNSNGTTNQPFYDLTRAGQAVLPSKIPDSGTAGRLALLALPAVLGGTGAGAGHAGGDTMGGTEAGLGLGTALALAGTRGGQTALTRLLADRPDLLVRIGQQVNNRAAIGGMFGAAATPSLFAR